MLHPGEIHYFFVLRTVLKDTPGFVIKILLDIRIFSMRAHGQQLKNGGLIEDGVIL